jgi:hypothetical protein
MSVHNGERYLREAVESILGQSFSDLEFIILDDGSTDSTWEILSSYGDPRIGLVRNEKNIGLTLSLNKGLALARGKYVARMDADDISLPHRLEMQVDFLERHPHIGVLGTAVQYMDSSGNLADVQRFPERHNIIRWSLCFYNPVPHPTVMVRRRLMEQVRGYEPDIRTAQDYDLLQRLSSVTRLANLSEVLLYLRKHNASITHLQFDDQLENCVGVSRRVIAGLLHEDVGEDLARLLWDQEPRSSKVTRRTARLIHRLCGVVTSNGDIPDVEKGMMRRDAARRMLQLIRPGVRLRDVWYILASASIQDSSLLRELALRRLQRVLAAAPGLRRA